MSSKIHITGAPCSWGVDDPKNPYLPPWQRVLEEAGKAGYKAIELGPYGYLPLDAKLVGEELKKNGISIVAGTIFDNLVEEKNRAHLLQEVDDICRLIRQFPPLPKEDGQRRPTPYLTVMDWGHDVRDYNAGHSDRAPRLSDTAWKNMIANIRAIAERAASHDVRAVVHPHAGGYIEFADEIDRLMHDIPDDVAGLCLDTGHLAYSGMNPVAWLRKYKDRLDYIHFKDINKEVYQEVMQEHIRFFDGCAKGSMCPIGKGMLDYPAIYQVLTEEIHYAGYITVEQERDPRNIATSLRDVKKSVDYLHSLGFH